MLGAGELAHEQLARDPYQIEAGVWVMDEHEAAGIADPLSSIVVRRTGGPEIPADLNDLINAGVAIVAYVITNALTAVRIRRNLRRAVVAEYVPPTDEETDQ